MNIRGMLTNVRIRCGDPVAQRPSDRTLLLLLSTQLQRFFNKTSLSGKPWAVDELTLTLAGNSDYAIPADSSFGKPIQVRTVPNTGEIERNIDFFELGELNHDWSFPQGYGGFSSTHSAARLAFFRKSGNDQVYVRALPTGQASASYKVLYQIGVYGETTSLDETPMLPEHHALIEIRTAIAALPHCQWGDDKADNANRRKELGVTLDLDSRDLERDFRSYISNMSASTRPSYRDMPFAID